jgi:hypothetical protein
MLSKKCFCIAHHKFSGNLTSKIPHMGGQGKQRLALMLVAIAVMAIGILE